MAQRKRKTGAKPMKRKAATAGKTGFQGLLPKAVVAKFNAAIEGKKIGFDTYVKRVLTNHADLI